MYRPLRCRRLATQVPIPIDLREISAAQAIDSRLVLKSVSFVHWWRKVLYSGWHSRSALVYLHLSHTSSCCYLVRAGVICIDSYHLGWKVSPDGVLPASTSHVAVYRRCMGKRCDCDINRDKLWLFRAIVPSSWKFSLARTLFSHATRNWIASSVFCTTKSSKYRQIEKSGRKEDWKLLS